MNILFLLPKKGTRHTERIVTSFRMIDKGEFSVIVFQKQDQAIFNKVLFKLSSNLKKLPADDLYFNYKKTSKTLKKHNNDPSRQLLRRSGVGMLNGKKKL